MSENTELIRNYIDRVWNRGDLTAIDERIASPITYHTPATYR